MKTLEYSATIIMILFLAWMLASWMNVVNHNNPAEQDGEPANWNAFVIMTEFME